MLAVVLLLAAAASAVPIDLPGCRLCSQWDLVANVTVDGSMHITKYRSKRTGLTIVLGDAESPVVHGYFCLATEAFTDDGLPHTLEHLIFLGSEDYPYKSVLDLIAKRCLAGGTNAWTQTDGTCYTINTAGSSGFLNILPVYMDHILFPQLTDDVFVTEVHHVTPDGKDSGVVYSEMQARENTPNSLMYYEFTEMLYPGGNISYNMQTGGKLKNLRESTTIEKIRDYHKKYYRTENMHVTVAGRVPPDQLFEALDRLETKVVEKRASGELTNEPWTERPFQRDIPDLTVDAEKTYQFPSNDENFGMVYMGWRVPGNLVKSMQKRFAMDVLLNYLTYTDLSPIKKTFINVKEPLATSVGLSMNSNWEQAVTAAFKNVPTDRIDEVKPRFDKVIADIWAGRVKSLDMGRIRTIIDTILLQRRENVENGPHFLVPTASLIDLLYSSGDDQEADLERILTQKSMTNAENLKMKGPEFWLKLMNETFSLPRVVLKGVPSKKLNDELQKNEIDRIKRQKEDMGPEGLKKAGEKIKDALAKQVKAPTSMVSSVPMAEVGTIAYQTLEHFNYTTKTQPPAEFGLKDIPYRFELENIKSEFIRFYIFLDMQQIPEEDRPYVSLLSRLWLKSPVRQENGTIIPFDEVVKIRTDIIPTFSNWFGGEQSHLMTFYAETKMENYEAAIGLVKEALFNVEFSSDRAKTIISKYMNSVPAAKKKATTVLKALFNEMYISRDSFSHHKGFLRQRDFLSKMKARLEASPAAVLAKLQYLRKLIVNPSTAFVLMATDVDSLIESYGSKSSDMWRTFFDGAESAPPSMEAITMRYPVIPESEFKMDHSPMDGHAIVALHGTESCFLNQGVDFPNPDWESSETAAVRVMLQYLSDRMFDQIRGQGWTYGVSSRISVSTGRIYVNFYRASDLANAYPFFREMVSNYTRTKDPLEWDPVLLDSAVGSLIYQYVNGEETLENMFHNAVSSYLRDTKDPFYSKRFVELLSKVTVDDVKRVALKYLPLFEDNAKTRTAVVCSPSQVPTIYTMMKKKFDIHLHQISDIEDSILTQP